MKSLRGDVGALTGMVAVLAGIAVGISFVLIALHYGNKRAQSAVLTMDGFPNPPPNPDERPQPYLRIVK